MPSPALRPFPITVAALGAAAVVAVASGSPPEPEPASPRLPGEAPGAIVAGGAASWVHAGPTGRAALHRGWRVRLDPAGRGAARGWDHGGFGGRPVAVPYVPNARALTSRSFSGSVAWYERDLRVRRSGRYVLRFESVNHRATVWLDGRRVGAHVGTYVPFEVRVTLDARRVNRLVVRADWRDPAAMKAEGWHRTWFNFGGINREVTLRRVGRSELTAPTIRTRLRGGVALVDVSVEVRNRFPESRAIPVEGVLAGGARRIAFRLPGVRTAPGDARVLRARLTVDAPALWSPAHPALYELQLAAGRGEAGYRAAVGLRELTWSAGRLRLNGRAQRLRGASLQEDARGRGDALRPADQAVLARELVRLGANATRCQHPLDPGLLERLDAAGVLVWMGAGPVDSPGSWTSRTPHRRRIARQRTMAAIREAQPHPSVIAYNLANELAGNGHDAGQVAYLRRMAREVRARDPGRLVALDVWGAHPPRRAGAVYRPADAIGVTNYTGWYDDIYAPRARLAAMLRARLARLRRTFPGKVLVVSEFGAEANELNAPGTPGSESFQASLLTRHIRTYEATPWLDGELVWNLQDFALAPSFAGGSIRRQVPGIRLVRGINQKGLFTYDGRPKPAVAAVRRAFGG
ncbi:MAG TPA: glycoside hydrolase family 2 TIM barrel-domain containing protein [Solirubrobacteraceae bacterium]